MLDTKTPPRLNLRLSRTLLLFLMRWPLFSYGPTSVGMEKGPGSVSMDSREREVGGEHCWISCGASRRCRT